MSASDPVAVGALITALEKVQGDELAADRTTQALPYLVAWLQGDTEFPRASLSHVYSVLLTIFALGSARGLAVYEFEPGSGRSTSCLGLKQKEYRDLIADIDEIAGEGFGIDMVYWVLELVGVRLYERRCA